VERPFSLEEERRVREAFTMGAAVECPRCGVPMRRREIGGGSFGLGYARRREWFLCPSCRGSVLFDAERGTRL
jgi:transposase-like protein